MEVPACKQFGTVLIELPHDLQVQGHSATQAITDLPITDWTLPKSHLYIWVRPQHLHIGLQLMRNWGFVYKTNLVWTKQSLIQQAEAVGAPEEEDFFHVTEIILFGVRGKLRTFAPGRRQTNSIRDERTEQLERFPPDLYSIIEQCSPSPFLEISSQHNQQPGWSFIATQVERTTLA